MRGIIFTTFSDFVETTYGYEVLDHILLQRDYPNGGGFSIGESYCPSKLVSLVEDLATQVNLSSDNCWHDFGSYSFSSLHQNFSRLYTDESNPIFSKTTFDFVERLNVLHFDELRKLYPQAHFPKFKITRDLTQVTLKYDSKMKLHYFVKGLLQGCIDHFEENIQLSMKVETDNTGKEYSEFTLIGSES